MPQKSGARLALITATAVATLSSACVSQRAVQSALTRGNELPAPVAVQRPVHKTLEDFGAMLGAYVTAATGERPIPIEIDFIGNETGIDKELPTDLGQYARSVIERIGGPFQTFRSLPAAFAMPKPAASSLPLTPTDRPKAPEPVYRVVGNLLRASERVSKGRDARADALFGGGHTHTDIQAAGEQRRTVTSLTLSLTLEGPNGVAVRGATAEYRIAVEKNEVGRTLSVYVAGSGLGSGSKLTVTQDTGDALYDAVAVSIVHLLGNALLAPYYRCAPVFSLDEALVARVRDAFTRLTRVELEQNIKRYLLVDGYDMDTRGPGLSDKDRAIVALELRRRSLEPADGTALVQLAMDLWKKLDYSKAARRVADRMAQSAHLQRERIESAAREEAALLVSPAEFGWAAETRFVTLDLARVTEPAVRDEIIAAVRGCAGCDEFRAHPTKMLLGVRISGLASEIQRSLRRARARMEFVWVSVSPPRLIVIPVRNDPARVAVAAAEAR